MKRSAVKIGSLKLNLRRSLIFRARTYFKRSAVIFRARTCFKSIIFSAFLILSLALFAEPVGAAELSGTVFSKGSPVANLTITVKGTEAKTKTGPKGEYRLDLPAGDHTLIVRGREFPVKVTADQTRHDIQL